MENTLTILLFLDIIFINCGRTNQKIIMSMIIRILLFFLVVLGCGCTSSDERHIKILIDELGIEFANQTDSNYVVIIPGNGCESCIRDAVNEIEEFDDTAYVFICNSEKDFYLQSGGKKASSFKNLYLDRKKITARLDMALTYPNVYLLMNGRLVSKTPYKSRKRLVTKQKLTVAAIDKTCIDLGKLEFGKTYKDSICIRNVGKETLYINRVHSSCECTEVEYASKMLAPSETAVFYVTFRPDVKGKFERLIFIDCNVKEECLEIPVKGNVVN